MESPAFISVLRMAPDSVQKFRVTTLNENAGDIMDISTAGTFGRYNGTLSDRPFRRARLPSRPSRFRPPLPRNPCK